ncbi:MAG: hypothetical protein GY722_00200 [bacterium]|nr:hypothetical protein [bacterium]
MAFLTLEDPNAKVKGSRDPLGILPIWSAFGRHVVTNLTTQTTSTRGFTILLLGRYLGAQLIDQRRIPQEEALDVVLRMEQIGAHIRYAAHDVDGDTRGIERVKRFQEEGRGKVWIHTDPRGLILADQKVTGLWGLYSVSARSSGLLPEGPVGVTEAARQFIEEHYAPQLNGALRPLMTLLERGGRLALRSNDPVYDALAGILMETFTQSEVAFYARHLLDAEETRNVPAGRQTRFRRLLEHHTDVDAWLSRDEMLRLIRAAGREDEALALLLERILHLESFLGPISAMFDYVLTQAGNTPDEVAEKLHQQWGPHLPHLDADAFQELISEIGQHSPAETARAIHKAHEALRTGDYATAVRALLDWNNRVMGSRKAGPWVRLADDGRIDVRYRGVERLLPKKDELPDLWFNSYFIDSLKRLCSQLRNVA